MTTEEELIRQEYRRRLPKHPAPFNRGGPVQRNPEDVVVEMILEERAASKSTLETYIAGAEAEKRMLREYIGRLERRLRALGGFRAGDVDEA